MRSFLLLKSLLESNSANWCFTQLWMQVVLNNATQETDNPDLRDRAYVYWRLLSTDPEVCFLKVLSCC